MALSGATILGQSRAGSDGTEGVLPIPQTPIITRTSPSDCLVPYPGHLLRGEVLPFCRGAVSVLYIPRVNVKTVLFQIIQFSTKFRGQNSV